MFELDASRLPSPVDRATAEDEQVAPRSRDGATGDLSRDARDAAALRFRVDGRHPSTSTMQPTSSGSVRDRIVSVLSRWLDGGWSNQRLPSFED